MEDANYVPYVTADMVKGAHAAGMQIIPWTIDDKPTTCSLIEAGVDGLITDYPDRLRDVMGECGMKLPHSFQVAPGH
ncbi:glycerophosphodiester phosphodiesterase [Pseudarthrobacter sp. N5]|uniref:glycerophosphodiester phosphodiesterase n=1 Tax=Pseudarthrobacter sp. N5 TaxID=3418416 RepID=UPI003CF5F961